MNYYGLVGEKLSHSLSPKIHNTVFKNLSIEGGYKLFEIDKNNIDKLGESMKVLSIKGVNVTIPYKEKVMEQLDIISDEAKEIGAVNTILNKENKLIGYNTDYYGFKNMLLDKNILVENKKVVVLGTGGASKAVVQYLLDANAKEIFLVSRDIQGKKSKKGVKLIDYNMLKEIEGYLIINTTPVGMYPNSSNSPVSEEIIQKYDCVVDLIYNPIETEFIKIGKKLGKITCGGLMMLVLQGIKADEIWENIEINKDIIEELYTVLSKEFDKE